MPRPRPALPSAAGDADAPAEAAPGRLALCATPVGNLDDITLRVLRELAVADLVLAEDTRRTGLLLRHHGIAAALQSLHDHNEQGRSAEVVARVAAGAVVALVSDAGTPVLADPGFRLVRAVIAAGLPVTALPGPSALLPALTLSGLPMHRFAFLGFAPRPGAARAAELAHALGLGLTLAWYESALRVAGLLADIAAQGGGDRPAAIARELSKLHEEVLRGSVHELAARCAARPPRGEIVLVVGPAYPPPVSTGGAEAALASVAAARRAGTPLPQAVAAAAERFGVDRRRLYAAAAERGGRPGPPPGD